MASEYSRELSAKVFAGQCRLIELGFRQGGLACFGLRRVLIDQSGAVKGELKRGEHKSLQTDRVILMPGPDHEVPTVNQIYRWLVEDDLPLADRSKKLTDAELLDHLKALYAECGRLSGFIIDQAPALHSVATYIQRFGSLNRAYELVGYHYPRSTEFLEINRRLRQLHPEIVSRTEHTIAELGGHITRDPKTDLLTLNDEQVVSLVLARCQTAANGHQRWRIRFDPARFDPDITGRHSAGCRQRPGAGLLPSAPPVLA